MTPSPPTLLLPDARRRAVLGMALVAAIGWRWCSAQAWDEQQMRSSMTARFGDPGQRRLQAWLDLLRSQGSASVADRLSAVNDFWNQQIVASLDSRIWKEEDYWATPIETLGKGAGDCEDFVIGKYFSLTRLGIPAQQLRLIYVRARVGGINSQQSIAHMVLGFYETPQSEPLVLDNLVPSIRKASQRSDLTPVFSFNAQGVYVDGARSAPVERINRWQSLLARMQKEGFAL